MTKTWQFRQPALPPAFPAEKHEIVRAFYVKYDQDYGLRRFSLICLPFANCANGSLSFICLLTKKQTEVQMD